MIRESLYFSFNNRKSTDFPIANVSIDTGLFEESVVSSKTINEIYPRYAFKPYYFGIQKEPKQIPLSFSFLEPWNDKMIDEVIRWLNVDEYCELFFEANIDRVFYAMPISDINLIHNGLKQGYLTLTMRCDSAYSYGHYQVTPLYDLSNNTKSRVIELLNYGHYHFYPNIEIHKIGDGDIKINNMSNGNKEFKLSNLQDGEVLQIDCMNEIIQSSLNEKNRYDDFNDEYLEIVYGKNLLNITGKCKIKFLYQYIFS